VTCRTADESCAGSCMARAGHYLPARAREYFRDE
jgi:hypothetical protein